jgi:hypothetical protein
MAYPQFPEPMVGYLEEISRDFVISHSDSIPDNSMTLMKPNAAFIEAFMAGLNHEMGRELLWREYPTDQRGTYFRTFWDTKDAVGSAPCQQDITPMDQWHGSLGANNLRADGILVLVLRGELLRRYPDTMIYAQKAVWTQPGQPRALCSQTDVTDRHYFRFPIIQATLDPDITLVGFDLSADEAQGVNGDAGWFFILKERPGLPTFGLDDRAGTGAPALDLKHLSWADFAPSGGGSPTCLDLDRVNLDPTLQSTWQAAHAADLAAYFFRNPVLFARHAREMLTKA